jgi:hypothetical protein
LAIPPIPPYPIREIAKKTGRSEGGFGSKWGRFAHKNQQKSQKNDADFEVVLLIVNGLSGILRPK